MANIAAIVCLLLLPFAACNSLDAYSGNVDLATFATGGGNFKIEPMLSAAASAGDVNNDGHPDLIFSLPGKGACVVFGDGSNFVDIDLTEFESGPGGFWLLDDSEEISVQGVGDVNGDGIDDIAVGTPNVGSGTVFVFYGPGPHATFSDTELSSLDTGSKGVRFYGDPAILRLGMSVGRAGDLNDDGLSDVFVIAFSVSAGPSVVYVVFGSLSFVSNIQVEAANYAGLKVVNTLTQFLNLASAAGDVNGDGIDDFAVGCNGIGVAVIYGSTVPYTDIDINTFTTGPSGVLVTNEERTDSLSSADYNADGFSDLLIGVAFLRPPDFSGDYMGFVLFGSPTPFDAIDLETFASGATGLKIVGTTPFDGCGSSFTSAGDVNGDGVEDIVIGCPDADPLERENAGAAYVLYGSNDTMIYEDVLLENFSNGVYANNTGFMIIGEQPNGQVHSAVQPAGDFNEDGYADVMVLNSNGEFTTYTYVVRGGNLPIPAAPTSAPTEDPGSDSAAALSTGAIIGIAVGGAAFLAIVGALCYVYLGPASAATVNYAAVTQVAASSATGTEHAVVPAAGAEQAVELVPV